MSVYPTFSTTPVLENGVNPGNILKFILKYDSLLSFALLSPLQYFQITKIPFKNN